MMPNWFPEQLYLDGVKNFDLDEAFSAGAWVKAEEEEGDFQTIMGNIGSKNSAWRGWIFYLDSLNRPAVKIVHSLSHNYLHVTTDQEVPIQQPKITVKNPPASWEAFKI